MLATPLYVHVPESLSRMPRYVPTMSNDGAMALEFWRLCPVAIVFVFKLAELSRCSRKFGRYDSTTYCVPFGIDLVGKHL